VGWFLKMEGHDYCPLCWTIVPDGEKPDTRIPNRLRLSGNHRLSIDPDVFEERMHAVMDADLWEAFDPTAFPAQPGDSEAAWEEHLRSRRPTVRSYGLAGMPGRAFLTPDEYRAAAEQQPGLHDDVMRQADDVAAHNIGYDRFRHQFGAIVDFNHDFGHPGMKYGWHYWLWAVPLIAAYALAGGERHAGAFAELFSQWYSQRDGVTDSLPGIDADVIWYELGIAVRTPVFVDAMMLMAGSPGWPRRVTSDLLRTIVGHCRWLYECSSRNPFHAYNWPIQTAVTLRYAATALPELREASRWRTQADAVLAEHLRRDFQADGGYQERTPEYTRYVLGLFLAYGRLLETHPSKDARQAAREQMVRAAIAASVDRCLGLWVELATPSGVPPTVNDARRRTELPALTAQRGAKPSGGSSVCCRSTGFAVMRSDQTPNARYLFFNFAPWSVHTHQDILSFECFADGAAIAVDPGIAEAGYGAEEHPAWYQAARGHNMLCVEEADPARHLVDVSDTFWETGPDLDFIAATHYGYHESFGVRHRRHVVFLKPSCWIVFDRVWSERPGLRLDWFLHCPLPLQRADDGWVSEAGPGLVVAAADAGAFEKRTGRGPADLEGLPGEARHRDIDWVSFRWMTRGGTEPQEIAVLIAPGVRSASIRRLPDRAGTRDDARFLVDLGAERRRVLIRFDRAVREKA
jgi:hypothetical protein